MAGWPTTISRNALGPELIDLIPAPNPNSFQGSAVYKLAWWTVSGGAQAASKAFVTFDGTDGDVLAHGESWQPNGGDPPTVLRNSAGNYTITYPASVEDETGESVSLGLVDAKVFPQATTFASGIGSVASGRIVSVCTFDAAGAALDVARIRVEVA